jgi:hypothetical protein
MSTKMSTVKSAVVMNTESIVAGVNKANKSLKSFGAQAQKTAKNVAFLANLEKLKLGFNAARATFTGLSTSIRGVTSSITGFITTQTELLKQEIAVAKQFGISQEQYATLGNVAAEAGIKIEQLKEPLFKVATSIEAARQGSGQAAAAFKSLGINAEAIAKLSPWERLGRIADAVKGIRDVNKQSLILNQIFGETGQRLREFLKFGSDGFEKMRLATIATGQALNNIGVQQVERLDAAIRDLTDNMQGLRNQILVSIEPAVSAFLKVITAKLNDPALRKKIMDFFTRVSETVGTFIISLISELKTTMEKLGNIATNLNNLFEPLRWPGYILNSPKQQNAVATPAGVMFNPAFDGRKAGEATKTILQEFLEGLAKLKAEMEAGFVKQKANVNPNAAPKVIEEVVQKAADKFKDVFSVATNAISNNKPGQLSGADARTEEGIQLMMKAFEPGYGEAKEVVLLKKSVKVQEKILQAVANDKVANLQGAM